MLHHEVLFLCNCQVIFKLILLLQKEEKWVGYQEHHGGALQAALQTSVSAFSSLLHLSEEAKWDHLVWAVGTQLG